ncbi:protein NOI4 isoform X2 [Cannabis sativa]|uniref:protein NOI4 isoform X2 n=1 Tax=Cannabis sativa TaxID=3483 RepID=UPI0011DF2C00|nr:protein NOI4 isoform X2 [Cannabis sativa]
MASQDKGRPLPKFGEWDVNNPASAEGFTVIFSKARDEKKSNNNGNPSSTNTIQRNDQKPPGADTYDYPPTKWFCCF